MKVLELFAGARCIGRAAEKLGHEVLSVDWTNYDGINLCMDIMNMSIDDIPIGTRHVHASFDCTSYAISAISHHRNGTEPKSDYAKYCDRVNQHVISLIKQLQIREGNTITYTFENPRGMLRKMPFMQEFKRYTVWYCQYGDDRAKPTDIWTNLNGIRALCVKMEISNATISRHHAALRLVHKGAKTPTLEV
jgi:site-specific DNA-cytosine methylase